MTTPFDRYQQGDISDSVKSEETWSQRNWALNNQNRARRRVYEYVKSKLDKKSGPLFDEDNVYIVWFTYVLGNWKALVSTTLSDGMYYEVTYNSVKNETYLDAYKKFDNVCFSGVNS